MTDSHKGEHHAVRQYLAKQAKILRKHGDDRRTFCCTHGEATVLADCIDILLQSQEKKRE